MTYKFSDEIASIEAELNYGAKKAEQEQEKISARQIKLQAELSSLEPRLLRANLLASRSDLICARCFILHDIESPLTPDPSDSDIDLFSCKKCGMEYEIKP